jgi:hypothetical protein
MRSDTEAICAIGSYRRCKIEMLGGDQLTALSRRSRQLRTSHDAVQDVVCIIAKHRTRIAAMQVTNFGCTATPALRRNL